MLELRTAYSRSFCGSRDEIIFIETDLLEKHRKKSHPSPALDAGRKTGRLPNLINSGNLAKLVRGVAQFWRFQIIGWVVYALHDPAAKDGVRPASAPSPWRRRGSKIRWRLIVSSIPISGTCRMPCRNSDRSPGIYSNSPCLVEYSESRSQEAFLRWISDGIYAWRKNPPLPIRCARIGNNLAAFQTRL